MANVLDELLDRGYIKQFTHEDETRELLEKEKEFCLSSLLYGLSS